MKALRTLLFLFLLATLTLVCPTVAEEHGGEKPLVVCTTHVLGSVVEELAGDEVEVVVFVQPGICPAFYDVKPSDVYALSKAKMIFFHGFEMKMWLKDMLKASGNPNITMVQVKGPWNTPEGAKQYVKCIGGNLTEHLGVDVSERMGRMISTIDEVASLLRDEAERRGVGDVKVVCMKWQSSFVEWLGFKIVAVYGPPESLSTADITNITNTAKREGAMLVVDNLQSGTDFGAELASEIGAVHVFLTNFPNAIPGTANLTEMFKYNARQLFDAVATWRSTQALRREVESLKDRLMLLQTLLYVAVAVIVVESVTIVWRKYTKK